MTPIIDLYSTSNSFREDEVKDKTVVVIDVLRTTSTISEALANGAKSVIPVADMGEASKIAQNLDPSRFLLCGEKDGQNIDGYHLGNSPAEYTREVVEGKTLILNTTNGTKAITHCGLAENVYIGSFLNLNAVINKIKTSDRDLFMVCAGWKGRLSLEDMLCAGALIHGLMDGQLWDTARDGAKIAYGMYDKYSYDIEAVVSKTNHAMKLNELNLQEDVAYCCKLNNFDAVPEYNEGIITLT